MQEKYACNLRRRQSKMKQDVHIQTAPFFLAFMQGVNAFALCACCRFRGEKAKLHVF